MTASSKSKAGEKAKDESKKDQEKETKPEVPKDPFVAALDGKNLISEMSKC